MGAKIPNQLNTTLEIVEFPSNEYHGHTRIGREKSTDFPRQDEKKEIGVQNYKT